MGWITGLSARRRMAVAGTAAGAVALVAAAALAAPGGDDEAHPRDTRPTEVAAAAAPTTTTRAPATSPPATAPTTNPARPAVAADTDSVAQAGHSGHDDHGGCGETGDGQCSEPGEASCGCDDGTIAAGPLTDGRHVVLLIGVDPGARIVSVVEPAQPDQTQLMEDDQVHVMSVAPGYDLTGVAPHPDRLRYWATIEGGLVSLLEPIA
jgi:hypothetical protein